ncbi:MAG TPA: hypothetical protein VFW11_24255 [Cyclobacteriaceae bacterium]|nr:hypothetical protein [Cyclobacteriaceae bacterium]
MRLIFLFLTFFFLNSEPAVNKGKWVIDAASKILIHGNTNVNKFVCQTNSFERMDTLEYTPDEKSPCNIVFSQTRISIPVKAFSCGNDMITKDFLETLKADRHPVLTINFLSIKDFTAAQNGGAVLGEVAIVLAGVSKKFNIRYTLRRDSKDTFLLTGKQPVCFTDFQLKAPRKMMGLIQVQEDLEVEFFMRLKVLH